MKTVSQLKDGVAAILSGIDLQNVDDLYGAFERAARLFVQKAKIPETQGTQNVMLYGGVYDYLIDERIFGTSIIDIRPQGISRNANDFVFKQFSADFDRLKKFVTQGTMATFAYSNGTPIIRIVTSVTPPQLILDTMTSIDGWTAGGDVTDLVDDPSFFYQQPGAMRFNLDGSTTQGYLEKTITAVDLTAYQGAGVVFLAIELPTEDFTSFVVRIGNDSSNYYEVSNTVGFIVNMVEEFFLVAFDLSLASTVGSPDITEIDYVRVIFNYNGDAQTNVRVGDLFISLPSPNQILYSSAGFFLVDEVVSTSITTDADEIILNDAAYTIYEYECALAILQQTGGASGDSTMASINAALNGARARNGTIVQYGLYDLYRAENPSEILRSSGSWYEGEGNNNFDSRF